MTDEIILIAEDLADPFGKPVGASAKLAERPTDLSGKTVVLLDNGKLSAGSGNLMVIFDILADQIETRFAGANVVRLAIDINAPQLDIVEAERQVTGYSPAAVILAMVDHGVSHRSIDLVRTLEARGIATCLLGSVPGVRLAAAISAMLIPDLPIFELAVTNNLSVAEISAATSPHVEAIVATLTRNPGTTREMQNGGANAALRSMPEPKLGLALWHISGERADPGHWVAEFNDSVARAGLGDGLPLMLPTRSRVEAMIEVSGRDRDHVLVEGLVPSGIPVTVERLAANAVMAGCRPEYFTLAVSAFEAMADPRYRLPQAAITSHPSGNLILFSGPISKRLGVSSGAGCLGPGNPVNLTIGRTISLTLINVGRIRPGEADLAPFGSPAEISYCLAEDIDASPWPGLNADLYGPEESCVLVHRCEAPHTVVDLISTSPESLLGSVASVAATLGANSAYLPAELIVLLNPAHAAMIARAGWSKGDVQRFLWEHARNPAEKLVGRGTPPIHPRSVVVGDMIPVAPSPEDILVVVAGGPGPHSMVATPWGLAGAVHRRL